MALEENRDVLALADPNDRILDCSCGIGTLGIALARLGYRVSCADGSQGMIDQAMIAAKNACVDLPLQCCLWADLADRFSDRFDLVFCLGNAIGHVRDSEEMVRSLCGMRAVLSDRGRLVLDSRNWGHIRKQRTRFTHYPWRERAGQRCLPIYIWNFPEDFEAAHTIEVVLVFEAGKDISIRSYTIVYYPFRLEDLIGRLRRAGFREIETKASENQEAYRVIAS